MSDDKLAIAIEGLRKEVNSMRREMHAGQVQASERLTAIETGLPAQLRAELESQRHAWRADMRREIRSLDTRVTQLEQGHARAKGALWAAGTAWAILVALPGAIMSWLSWTGGTGGQP